MANNRSDSTDVQTRLTHRALKKISPPAHCYLPDKHLPFWEAITASKAEWTTIDLLLAVTLARTLHDIECESLAVSMDGYVVDGRENPRGKLLEMLTRRSLSLCRSLNIHAAATQGRARDQANKNRVFRETQEALDDVDDLIAKPTEH